MLLLLSLLLFCGDPALCSVFQQFAQLVRIPHQVGESALFVRDAERLVMLRFVVVFVFSRSIIY